MYPETPANRKNKGYKELASRIIAAIEAGQLPAHSPLPPSRVMADSVGLSRDTVLRCYKHLQSLGYIESMSTRGTFVRSTTSQQIEPLAQVSPVDIDKNRLSIYGSMVSGADTHSIAPDFPALNFGSVPPQSLPLRRWRELMQARAPGASVRDLRYDREVLGRSEFRQAIAAYVNRSKGIRCSVDEIAVFNLSFTAFSLICRLLLNPGDLIAVENPGFGGIKNVAAYDGFEVFPVPLDDEGLIVEKLSQAEKPIKLVYVTPDHQEPTGRTMSYARRKQLLAWAETNSAWIMEDDYDSFFHYGRQPPANLKSMDRGDHVIYFATFWQLLYPLTTVGFLVVPRALMPILTKSKIQTEGMTETTVQLAVSDLLDSGYLQKHARKLERIFSVKRRALMFELKRVFGRRVQVARQSGGTTFMLQFNGWTDGVIMDAARAANLPLLPTDYYYKENKGPPGEFVTYFPNLGDEWEIKKVVESFSAHLGKPA